MRQIVARDSLQTFLNEVASYPLLSKEEETQIAIRYYESGDLEAARILITSNLRFVVKIATEYLRYGFPLADLIQEGVLGLMRAVKKFNPYRGIRLISYAVWWVRAYIHNYIMRSWSLVKIGTTQAQRKLFQKIGRRRSALGINGEIGDEELERLASEFEVNKKDIIDMELRTSGRDASLDRESGDDTAVTYVELLKDEAPSPQDVLEGAQFEELQRAGLRDGLEILSPRERYIIEKRFCSERPLKLRELGEELNISKERVRQIESNALLKLRAAIEGRLSSGDSASYNREI
jgi:RNA polymerase sigma-32 factor